MAPLSSAAEEAAMAFQAPQASDSRIYDRYLIACSARLLRVHPMIVVLRSILAEVEVAEVVGLRRRAAAHSRLLVGHLHVHERACGLVRRAALLVLAGAAR